MLREWRTHTRNATKQTQNLLYNKSCLLSHICNGISTTTTILAARDAFKEMLRNHNETLFTPAILISKKLQEARTIDKSYKIKKTTQISASRNNNKLWSFHGKTSEIYGCTHAKTCACMRNNTLAQQFIKIVASLKCTMHMCRFH